MPRNHEFVVAGQHNSSRLDIVPTNPVLRADPVILSPIGSSTPKLGALDLNNNETRKASKRARKAAKYARRVEKAQLKETKARTAARASKSKKFRTVTLKTVNFAKHRQSFIEPESQTLEPENARLDASQPDTVPQSADVG